MVATKHLAYNYTMFGFAPYSPYWCEMKKIVNLELLCNCRLELLKHVRVSELETSLKDLCKLWMDQNGSSNHALIEMKQWFGDLSLNVVFRMVVRKRLLDIGGQEKAMKETTKELDAESTTANLLGCDADPIIKSNCLSLIGSGSDTTKVTIVWALSLLLNNRHCLRKVKEEFDTQVGKERLVNDSDLSNLKYLQAVVKETLRLYSPAPLFPCLCTQDFTTVNGYYVSAGTWIFWNLWKIQTDPSVWSDPYEFRPEAERFLTTRHEDVDVRGQHFEMIPFG
ncbi:hypothetical protein PTKIN_Ptkin13bG0035700 [Pterospermum kingtungense]